MTRVLAVLVLLMACRLPGNERDPGCLANSTQCRNDRPYVCASGEWRPVGDTACAPVGGVCCLTAAGVHSCVAARSCVVAQ